MVDSRRDEAAVAQAAALIARQLDDKLRDTTLSVQELLVTEISELRGEAQLLQLLRETVAVNVDALFSAIRHGIPITEVEPPTAALEYARRLAQREVSANALVRAYRLGHRAVLDVVLDEIRASSLGPQLRLDVYALMEAISFDYIDWISQRVVATYHEERDRWVASRNSLRALQVRELLSGSDVDVDSMATAIRYPLRRIHLALVVWCAESDATSDGLEPMEQFVLKLSESIGARDVPLFVPVDRVTGWAWIPVPADAAPNAVVRVRAFAEAAKDAPFIAVGDPLEGVEGFRRSHQHALATQIVAMASGATARRVTAVSDPGLSVAALLGGNVDAASAWVGEVLGPLASPTESDERLRETLRVFLKTGSSYTAAADELHLHFNSVRYRVQRAVERRGRPITDDRLDVEVALLLCRWFDAAVLS